MISGKIEIPPFPCERPRFSFRRTYNTGKYSLNKQVLAHLLKQSISPQFRVAMKFFDKPIGIALEFHVKRSKRSAAHLKQWPAKTPDVDNYIKAFMDAANGILFEDDCQVCYLSSKKVYCEGSEKPHIKFRAWELFQLQSKSGKRKEPACQK